MRVFEDINNDLNNKNVVSYISKLVCSSWVYEKK